jgi:glycine cleavage system H protein
LREGENWVRKTIDARVFVNGRGPRPKAVGGIAPKARSFIYPISPETNEPIKNEQNRNNMSKVLEGLKYSETHEWVKLEGDIAIIGVTDFAQKEMGEITYVDCPDVDDEVEKGGEFGALESVKAASDLFSPVSGTVTEVNEEVVDDPKLVNDDAFENWIIKVQMSDTSELDDLMDAAAYKAFIKE